MRLFADDTIVFLTIHAYAQNVQVDLQILEQWNKEWSMEFKPDKSSSQN